VHRSLGDNGVDWRDADETAHGQHHGQKQEIPVVCRRLFEMEAFLAQLGANVLVKEVEDRDDGPRDDGGTYMPRLELAKAPKHPIVVRPIKGVGNDETPWDRIRGSARDEGDQSPKKDRERRTLVSDDPPDRRVEKHPVASSDAAKAIQIFHLRLASSALVCAKMTVRGFPASKKIARMFRAHTSGARCLAGRKRGKAQMHR
jgi:hypothetical protein